MNSGYPTIDWIDESRFMIVYHTKAGVQTPREIEGAIYTELGYEHDAEKDREYLIHFLHINSLLLDQCYTSTVEVRSKHFSSID